MTETPAPTARLGPYQGLGAYGEQDADFFFGRDEERDVVIAHLKATRLTVVYGPSGVGKTSLLRAGVEATVRALALANRQRLGTLEFVPVVFSAWRDDPSGALAAAIAGEVTRLTGEPMEPAASLAQTIISAQSRTDATLLLILDQFEDLALYQRTQSGPRNFAAEFPELVNDRRLALNVLISIREDALAQLDRFRGSIPRLLDSRLRVAPLTGEAAGQAVTGPLEKYSEGRPPQERFSIEPELVTAVLGQVRAGEVGFEQEGRGVLRASDGSTADFESEPIETPYLQLVMTAIWEAETDQGSRVLRLETLAELGDATRIVRSHLDRVLHELTPAQREVAVEVFRFLVTPSGMKIAFGIRDLAELSGRSVEQVEELVVKLESGQERILRRVPPPPGDEGEPGVEIFHDVLASAILAWRTEQMADRLERQRQAAVEETRAAEQQAREERRRARIFRGLAVAAFTLLLVAMAAVVVALELRGQANRARNNAESGQLAAQAEADYLGQGGTLGRGLLLSMEAYRTARSAQARDALVRGLEATQGMVAYLSGQAGPIGSVAFAPGGRTLATASADGTVVVWNIRTGRRLETLRGHTKVVESVAFSPSGETVASAGLDGEVIVWNVATGRTVRAWRASAKGLYSVAFSPSGKLIATAGSDRTIVFWNTATGRPVRVLRGHRGLVYAVAFNRTGTLLATASGDRTVGLWDVATGRRLRTLRGHAEAVYGVAFSPDGTMVASGSADQTVALWDVATGQRLHVLTGHRGAVEAVAFSPDGSLLASASSDDTVGLWDPHTGRLQRFLRGHTATVQTVAFSPNGATLASGSDDESAILWDATPAAPRAFYARGGVLGIAFNQITNGIAAATQAGFVNLWNFRTGQLVGIFKIGSGAAEAVAFSPDGRALAAAGADGSVTVWNLSSKQPPLILSGGREPLYGVAFSPNGRTLAAAGADGAVLLWNAKTGTLERKLTVDSNPLFALAFSPDGNTIAVGGADSTVILWEADGSGRPLILTGHTSPVQSVAFSPNGTTLASGSQDQTVILWSPKTGHELGAPLRGHLSSVNSVAFSADGKYLASGSADDTEIVWNVDTGLGQPVGGHTQSVTSVAFSPVGGMLASGDADGQVDVVRSFPASDTPNATYDRLCGVVRRNLSSAQWREFLPGRAYQKTCPGYS